MSIKKNKMTREYLFLKSIYKINKVQKSTFKRHEDVYKAKNQILNTSKIRYSEEAVLD